MWIFDVLRGGIGRSQGVDIFILKLLKSAWKPRFLFHSELISFVCVFSSILFSVTCLEMISFFRQIGSILKIVLLVCECCYLSKKVKDTDIHLTSVLFCTLNGSTIDVETSSSKIFVRTTFVPLFLSKLFLSIFISCRYRFQVLQSE